MRPQPPPRPPALSEAHAALLREIDDEIALTAEQTGVEALAPAVRTALARVPRPLFVPLARRDEAFVNGPLPIGHRQTISQPFMVALMTQLLDPQPDSQILEIGCGSGYQAAVLAELVRRVHSVEIVGALAEAAATRLAGFGYDNVTVHHADGYFGWSATAPYDGIIVTAAAPAVPPPLIEQLRPGGRLVIPLGQVDGVQTLKLIRKHPDGGLDSRNVLMVAFVPLTRALRAD